MADLNVLIETSRGLGTVVEVRPGRLEPSLSQVIAEAVGGEAPAPLPLSRRGTPMPGQAQSAASFIQTLILPSEGQIADLLPVSQPEPAQAVTAYQATQQRDQEEAFHATLARG